MEGEKRVIKPTVGRAVLYWPDGPAMKEGGQQPHAAVVAYVHDDRKVNLATFDQYGKPGAVTSAVLRQPDDVIATGAFAEWMEYQIAEEWRAKLAGMGERLADFTIEVSAMLTNYQQRIEALEAKAGAPGGHLTDALAQAERDNPVKSG